MLRARFRELGAISPETALPESVLNPFNDPGWLKLRGRGIIEEARQGYFYAPSFEDPQDFLSWKPVRVLMVIVICAAVILGIVRLVAP